MSKVLRWMALGLAVPIVLVVSGLLLADHLTPPATGAPGVALATQPAQTLLDRELAPLLAAQPGKTGVIMLPDGLDAFAARAIATRRAGRSLDLQYYIWHHDLIGHLLAREVHAAAERGVRVRLLLDDMNAEGLDPALMALDAHPNIELRLYNPFRNRDGAWRLVEMLQRVFSMTHRMHNKAWIADGRVAVVGGRNIGEEYFSADPEVNFRDLDLLLFGPAVQQASAVFDDYWNSAAVVPIASLSDKSTVDLERLMTEIDAQTLLEGARPYLDRVARSRAVLAYEDQQLEPRWTARLQVVADPPVKRDGDDTGGWLVTRLVQTLAATRSKALLISPYFVPGEDGMAFLSQLARRGAEVGIVTNSLAANDVPAVHSGYSRYREQLLRDGVRLHELHPRGEGGAGGLFGSSGASLHTKAFVVDDRIGFVGSFNLDPRSANLNTEMGVLFDDPRLARDLRDEYLRLAGPRSSYWVYLDPAGELRWLDRAVRPPVVLDQEPETSAGLRALVRVLGWLPIESQL